MSWCGLALSVNKPLGWTSFDVVNKLRRSLEWKSVGHAGTLDPAATGVLIVLCGSATSSAVEFQKLNKEYRALIRFGVVTDSDDLEGEVIETRVVPTLDFHVIESALAGFHGDIEQVPPAYSAVKVQGKRSYALARKGKAPILSARTVSVYQINCLRITQPEIEISVTCSGGTYIRSLARDLGSILGCGGTLAGLVRTAIGPYRVEHALSIDQVLARRNELRAS